MTLMRTVTVTIIVLITLPNPSFTQSLSALPEANKDPFVGYVAGKREQVFA